MCTSPMGHGTTTTPAPATLLTPQSYRADHLAELDQPIAGPRLWLVNLAASAIERDSMALLDAKERAKATAFRFPLDRAHFIASHCALRRILGAHLKRGPEDIQLSRAACPVCGASHGRPVVEGSSLQFSLSRRAGYCLIALAPTVVGVDLEVYPKVGVADELSNMLHPREQALLQLTSTEQRGAVFAQVWTRKEAYLKGLGIGLARGTGQDYVAEDVQVADWKLYNVAAPAGLAAALAVKDPPVVQKPAPKVPLGDRADSLSPVSHLFATTVQPPLSSHP